MHIIKVATVDKNKRMNSHWHISQPYLRYMNLLYGCVWYTKTGRTRIDVKVRGKF